MPHFSTGKVYFAVAVENVGVHTTLHSHTPRSFTARGKPEKPYGKELAGEKIINSSLNTPLNSRLNVETRCIKSPKSAYGKFVADTVNTDSISRCIFNRFSSGQPVKLPEKLCDA